MRIREPHLSNLSGYPKTGGIIKATKAAPFVDNLAGKLSPAERKQREMQAQADYRKALKKLNKQA